MESRIREIAERMSRSQKIVGFTGAGVSTESGIPDFRSPGGLWSKYDPNDATIDRFMRLEEVRERYWQRHTEMYTLLKKVRPNHAHTVFVKLYQRQQLSSVITQNIDGLHLSAGLPQEKVIELHGTAWRVHCMQCGQVFDREAVHQRVLSGEKAPKCSACHGPLKPATISFGQALDQDLLSRAFQEVKSCDLLLCMGSSLVVQPAASLPFIARENGVSVVLINRDATPFDDLATVVVHASCGEVMCRVEAWLDEENKEAQG